MDSFSVILSNSLTHNEKYMGQWVIYNFRINQRLEKLVKSAQNLLSVMVANMQKRDYDDHCVDTKY